MQNMSEMVTCLSLGHRFPWEISLTYNIHLDGVDLKQ